jgi:hypothetical protein
MLNMPSLNYSRVIAEKLSTVANDYVVILTEPV